MINGWEKNNKLVSSKSSKNDIYFYKLFLNPPVQGERVMIAPPPPHTITPIKGLNKSKRNTLFS